MVTVERLSTEQAWQRVDEQVATLGFASVEDIRQAVLNEDIDPWDWRLTELSNLLWLLDEPPVTACCVRCLRETLEREN